MVAFHNRMVSLKRSKLLSKSNSDLKDLEVSRMEATRARARVVVTGAEDRKSKSEYLGAF